MAKYYEIELGVSTDKGVEKHWLSPVCIKVYHYPTVKEVEELLEEDMKRYGQDCVIGINYITKSEAKASYDIDTFGAEYTIY